MKRTQTMMMLAGLLALVLAFGTTGMHAQDNGNAGPTAAVETSIGYQGVLTEAGEPVDGSRDMTFRLYTDDTCATQVGTDIVQTVSVSNGLFSIALPMDASLFNGQMLYIQAEVSDETLGCSALLPAPYALNIVPGAEIDSDAATSIFRAINQNEAERTRALYGKVFSEVDDTAGVYGHSAGASGETYGVYGKSDTAFSGAAGVYGTSTVITAGLQVYGVYGYVDAPDGRGVQARNDATSGQARAVYGRSASMSDGAQAIYGHAAGTSGETSGIYGKADSPDGYGVYGLHNATDLSANGGAGVYATSVYTGTDYQVYGVFSEVDAPNARAIQARNDATNGQARAVYGRSASTSDDAQAIYGHAAGASGETSGIYGKADSPDGYGVYGLHNATDLSANGGAGVYATSVYTGTDYQVYGVFSEVDAPNARAIQALNDATSGQARAIYGKNFSVDNGAQAIYGHAAGASGETSGIYGKADSPDGYGLYGENTAGGVAGYFTGDVEVKGSLEVTGTVTVDNDGTPYTAATSPDELAIYTGNVTLDGSGNATITLPDEVSDLYTTFTYQVTPLASTTTVPYISSQFNPTNDEFVISGEAGIDVSWTVYAK